MQYSEKNLIGNEVQTVTISIEAIHSVGYVYARRSRGLTRKRTLRTGAESVLYVAYTR